MQRTGDSAKDAHALFEILHEEFELLPRGAGLCRCVGHWKAGIRFHLMESIRSLTFSTDRNAWQFAAPQGLKRV